MNNEKIGIRITMALWRYAHRAACGTAGADGLTCRAGDHRSWARVVHTALGGFILGYDIDQNGNEGLLAEALTTDTGHDVALETFDIRTGEIIRVVRQRLDSKSDYVTLGIVGSHVGLVEYEHVTNLFVDARLYFVMNPINANRFTGRWTPPLTTQQIISGVSSFQGSATTAVMASDISAFNAMILGRRREYLRDDLRPHGPDLRDEQLAGLHARQESGRARLVQRLPELPHENRDARPHRRHGHQLRRTRARLYQRDRGRPRHRDRLHGDRDRLQRRVLRPRGADRHHPASPRRGESGAKRCAGAVRSSERFRAVQQFDRAPRTTRQLRGLRRAGNFIEPING